MRTDSRRSFNCRTPRRTAACGWPQRSGREAEKQAEKRERLEAEKRETLEAAGTGDPQEIFSQLRALYKKALPEHEPLVQELSDGTADGSAENLPHVAEPLVEVAVEDEPVCCEAEAPEPGETASVEVSLVAEHLNRGVQYRMERVPGYFPAKYRRVRIEP